jgi:hypothetical protein
MARSLTARFERQFALTGVRHWRTRSAARHRPRGARLVRHKRWAVAVYVIGLFGVFFFVFHDAGRALHLGAVLTLCTLGDVRWGSRAKRPA